MSRRSAVRRNLRLAKPCFTGNGITKSCCCRPQWARCGILVIMLMLVGYVCHLCMARAACMVQTVLLHGLVTCKDVCHVERQVSHQLVSRSLQL